MKAVLLQEFKTRFSSVGFTRRVETKLLEPRTCGLFTHSHVRKAKILINLKANEIHRLCFSYANSETWGHPRGFAKLHSLGLDPQLEFKFALP
uniref:Uncharacterized protein n=1 Tax=Physcomitrium patens TaxID=3218 RepID=A0A2K1KE91_PHYPA|nr:hypothetical protein PHYPA_008470 [Physcomitrium patens]